MAEFLGGSVDAVAGEIAETRAAIEGLGEQLEDIHDTMVTGFLQLSFDLREISHNVKKLQGICEYGFDMIVQTQVATNELLATLVTRIETPDQVWAEEKFANARICVQRQLWQEALEYLDLAIHGDQKGHIGFKIEPTFHFLEGMLHCGSIATDLGKV